LKRLALHLFQQHLPRPYALAVSVHLRIFFMQIISNNLGLTVNQMKNNFKKLYIIQQFAAGRKNLKQEKPHTISLHGFFLVF
jgi:hypothetical protein